jgi:TolB-like protein
VADLMLDNFGAPGWVIKSVLTLLIFGFPLAIFFAWAFELTPEGLKLEKNVDRNASITPVTGRKLDRTIIVLLAIAVVYFAWQSLRPGEPEQTEASGDQSIAVLPFVNMSSDAEQEYFSDGLSEELLNLLAKIPDLRVASRTSAFSYKGKDLQISDIGKELDVAHVLEGSVRKSGSKIRITAQLISVDDDAHLWSETWDRSLDDIFVIQDEIAKAVVDELKVRLMGELPQAVEIDPEAFSLYLQARHLMLQRTRQSLLRAEELIDEALSIAPSYVPGWTLKASIHSTQGDTGAVDVDTAFANAREAAETALQIDPEFGRAHAALADVLISHFWDFEGGRQEIEKALALDPGDLEILYLACNYYGVTGAYYKAVDLCEKAIDRDPLFAPVYPMIGVLYQFLDDPETALMYTSKLLDLAPAAAGTHYYVALGLISNGDIDAALERLEYEVLDGFRHTGFAIAYHAAGNEAASDEALQALSAMEDAGWYYQVAIVHAFRGETDAAIEALSAAIDNHDSGITLMLGDPYLDNVRNDPRFEEIVERVGIRLY